MIRHLIPLTVLIGYQFGLQFGVFSQSFVFSPYAFSVTQSGSGESDGVSFDIDEYTSNTIGFDIMHKSSGITLSSIMHYITQESGGSNNEDVDIFMIKIGKSF